ncbi:hypothetical protein, partial [Holdemanella sp. DFI.5.21]|uniref:hypothetical protein n=1 Tax=Holdemanella sp. DFI.5.21 TaxID=2916964 RepID=UPI001EE85551
FSDDNQDTKDVKRLLEFLTSPADVRRVATTTAHHVTIKIAKEIDEPLLKSFSLITRAFTVPNQGDGVIALLGPIR